MAGNVSFSVNPQTSAQPSTAQPNVNTLNSILQDKQMAEGAGAGTSNFNIAHTAAQTDYNTLKQSGIDPTQFQNMNASQLQSYINSQSHPQTGTTGSTAQAQTGTTAQYPNLNMNLASTMLSAAKSPTPSTSSQDYSVLNGEKLPQYQGKTFTTIDDLAKQTGIEYKKDPVTGAITLNGNTINPIGYDKTGQPIVYVRQFLNAAGVSDQNISYDGKSHNISYTAPQDQLQMPQMPQIQQYQAPDLSSYYNNLMPVQQQFTPDWGNYYQQAQQQYDPLTQLQINTLTNKQGMDITKADEGLNAKGIFNSGIAVQMENQIRANTNDQVAKVLMTEQSNIAKQAQVLYQDAFKQWSQGNTDALKNNQMWLTQAMDQQKQQFTQWLQTQKLSLDQYNYALNAWDKAATLAQKDAQFQATQQMDMYKFNNLSADQQANLAQNQQKMMLPYTMGPTPAQMLPYQYMTVNQQATNQLDYAKLAETIRNNQANEVLKATQLMGYDPSGKPTLDMQKYNEMVQNDQAKAQQALMTASNNQDRTLITKYQAQITSINNDIKNYIGSHDMTQKANQDAVDQMVSQKNSILSNIDQIGNSSSSYGSGPFTTDQLTSIATKAAVKAGVPQSWVDPLVKIAMHESSGNPMAVNPQGIDPTTGGSGNEHATGLMQTLPSTFSEYSNGNINDPVDNMVAAIGYIKSRYGDPNVALQKSLNGGY